jgi:hypothetical protein
MWTSRRVWALAWEDQAPPVDVQAVGDVVDEADVFQGGLLP